MEKIKVGEYVRTKQGHIYKVKSVYKDMVWYCDIDWIASQDIVKHSKKIIDLIEIGDYVNYDLIAELAQGKIGWKRLYTDKWIKNKDIKFIVTKEQFEKIGYRVED